MTRRITRVGVKNKNLPDLETRALIPWSSNVYDCTQRLNSKKVKFQKGQIPKMSNFKKVKF